MNDATQVGITLAALNALGFFLKNYAPWLDNKYIPTVLVVVGVVVQLTAHGATPQNALEGFLAAVGAIGGHSLLKNTVQPSGKPQDKPPQS